jgi:biopolymer transport protein ExbB
MGDGLETANNPVQRVNRMLSKSAKIASGKRAWKRIPYLLGASFVALIVISGVTSTYGQQAPESLPSAQRGAPAPTPAPSPVSPSDGAEPQTVAPPAAAGAPSPAGERSETSPVAGAAPAAERPADPLPAAEQTTAAATLPQDLTPFGMFMSADIIVKAVMLGLIFASVLTWTIWLAKSLELWGARRRLRRAQRTLNAAQSFAEAAPAARATGRHVAMLLAAVETEFRRSPDLRDIDGIKERIAARFERVEAAVGRRMMRATGILATIGATAPFVGLFGTVWGIMNSFIGISKLHTTNLAVVAPGIAEALLATACGLAAAIPAVVIYNGFARSIAHYRALFADATVEILALVSRDLSQEQTPRAGLFDPRLRSVAAPAVESSR